jgi:hypothetical protein
VLRRIGQWQTACTDMGKILIISNRAADAGALHHFLRIFKWFISALGNRLSFFNKHQMRLAIHHTAMPFK